MQGGADGCSLVKRAKTETWQRRRDLLEAPHERAAGRSGLDRLDHVCHLVGCGERGARMTGSGSYQRVTTVEKGVSMQPRACQCVIYAGRWGRPAFRTAESCCLTSWADMRNAT